MTKFATIVSKQHTYIQTGKDCLFFAYNILFNRSLNGTYYAPVSATFVI